jgi:hypothetical protein
MTQSLTLLDRRVVDVLLGGDRADYPLVMHHETPADATTLQTGTRPGARLALDLRQPNRLCCVDAPGWPLGGAGCC